MEQNGRHVRPLRVPGDVYARLLLMKERTGHSVNKIVTDMIRAAIEEEEDARAHPRPEDHRDPHPQDHG